MDEDEDESHAAEDIENYWFPKETVRWDKDTQDLFRRTDLRKGTRHEYPQFPLVDTPKAYPLLAKYVTCT